MKNLSVWMKKLNVHHNEFKEQFVTSPGKGGQNVNKVATAVHLTHFPTGLSVKCHQEREQGKNRYLAWVMLLEKIEQLKVKQRQAQIHEREKLRRQKRGRSAKGKELMLAEKKLHSVKKQERSIKIII